MANDCNYELRATSKDREVLEYLLATLNNSDYDYLKNTKPKARHFFRVDNEFGEIKETSNGYVLYAYGWCAWSVHCCMLSGKNSYYNEFNKEYPDIFMGTTLGQISSLGCEIEVFSEEEGMEFSEHIVYINGTLTHDTCAKMTRALRDSFGRFRITNEVDSKYSGEVVWLNPNRERLINGWLWEVC